MHRITRLETFDNEFVCFVRLTTEDGRVGWGQCSTYNADITAQVFHRQLAPWALGWSVEDIDGLLDRIWRKEHKYPGSYLCRAMAGLDTAIWDWRGKAADQPVVSLLGGQPGRLRAYASSMKRDITPVAEAARMERLVGDYGFDAVKWRIGAELAQDRDEWPGRTEAIISLMAERLGPRIDKLVDANSAFCVPRAIAVGQLLQDHGIDHYEEPVDWWDYPAMAAVRAALQLDVTGGEQEFSPDAFAQIIAAKAVDIVQPDIMYLGGITRTLKVVQMAQEAGLPCTPHSANLSLVTLCTMHLMGAIKNAGKYLELSIEGDDYYPWQHGLFLGNPFAVDAGCVQIPAEPGWGVHVNPQWLEGATHRVSSAQDRATSAYEKLYHKGETP